MIQPSRPFSGFRLPQRTLRRVAALAALAILCTVCGCSSVQVMNKPRPELPREWPLESDGARVVWVRTIADFKEFGQGRGFWRRALELLGGAEEQRSIVRPYGVVHDASGRLYLADPGAGVVHCLDLKLGSYSVIGAGTSSPLRSPIGLASDHLGKLYISDSVTGMVYRYDSVDGSLRPFLAKKLTRPTGMAFNPVNRMLYIVDTVESQVVAVGLDGIERDRLGASGADGGDFNHPTDIAVDGIGQLLVTDSLNFRITVLTPEGEILHHFGAVGDAEGQFSRPKGIAVDSAGHVYVCDALRDAVLVFDAAGKPLLTFGRAGSDNGQFWMPSGLYIDRSDHIYVADTFNKRIQIFKYLSVEEAHPGDESNRIEPDPGARAGIDLKQHYRSTRR